MSRDLAQRVLQGERRALARALSLVENDAPEGEVLLEALFPHTGRAHLVGFTGPPGVGKSTLVARLARYFRQEAPSPHTVGILAVDPTSPFTGGALLGDRIRMRDLAGDPGVFIRSMASRGAVGGLARNTAAAAQVLDAAGFDLVFIETVGAGQAEVEIARLAHTVVVVQAPGLGDEIQALKAGILEIADVLVVNKADRPGARQLARTLENWLGRRTPKGEGPGDASPASASNTSWIPPVLLVTATQGEGLPQVAQSLKEHAAHLKRTGAWQERERRRFEAELRERVLLTFWRRWETRTKQLGLPQLLERILKREISPQRAAETLLRQMWSNQGTKS